MRTQQEALFSFEGHFVSQRKQKPKIELARAAQRLAAEQVRPISELTGVSGASLRGLVRWIREGKSGVYLDGIRLPEQGWCSSVPAVRRFLKAVAEKKVSQVSQG